MQKHSSESQSILGEALGRSPLTALASPKGTEAKGNQAPCKLYCNQSNAVLSLASCPY